MSEARPIRCVKCGVAITPTTIGRADVSQRLPLCRADEEKALLRVRPSPRNRQAQPDRTR